MSSPTFPSSNDKLPFQDPPTCAKVVNAFGWAAMYSSQLPYNTPLRYIHTPYPTLLNHFRLHLMVTHVPFERHMHLEKDLLVLFDFIAKEIIPAYEHSIHPWKSIPRKTQYFARFIGFEENCDSEQVQNPNAYNPPKNNKPNGRRPYKIMPSKERHIVIETNYDRLGALLADPNLFILADHLCFHVCWNGKEVLSHVDGATGEGEEPNMIKHDAKAMRQACNDIYEGGGLRARHRKTDGLPCNSLKFAAVQTLEFSIHDTTLMLV